MKKILVATALLALVVSCKDKVKTETPSEEKKELPSINDSVLESSVIYEANIRQYSNEGTFDAFTKDIPQLKELGVKVIWLMPVFPISETKRKATGGDFASLIEDESERAKMLGSYYAVSDFTEVNPEFGSKDDIRELIATAHDNDMYVILDWVPNHTGWDHVWLKDHPEYYTKNAEGEITDPLNEDGTPVGWADVADLNYDNKALWEEMTADMKYWITEEGIDGFRCDVAGSVPVAFWEYVIPKLRAEKDIFMLAEAWEPELLKGDLFEMAYAWEGHHIMNEIAKGEKSAKDWDDYMVKMDTVYENNDILMNFITNHDENSWNGTVRERMGNAAPAMLAMSYTVPGMPLIYSGQEYDLNHRLKFFEKDSIPKSKGEIWNTLKKLGELKSTHTALNGGKNAASYERLKTSNDEKVLAFKRSKEESELIFVANLNDTKQNFMIKTAGTYKNAMTGDVVELDSGKVHKFKPWEYLILVK